MAIGDAIQAIANVAASGTLSLQPGSGVEAVLTGWATDGEGVAVNVELWNGTVGARISASATTFAGCYDFASRALLTNTIYARINNTTGAAYDCALTAVQTK